jgi:hypothetical protein
VKPIISVKEARKLLGIEYKDKADGEILELIEQVHEFARIALKIAQKKRLEQNRDKPHRQ